MDTLTEVIKEDFIESMRNMNDYSVEKALEFWRKYGEQYLDSVFQDMSDRMVEIANKEDYNDCSIWWYRIL